MKTLRLPFALSGGAVIYALFPEAARACTVCMGQPGSNLQRGFYWGILLLLLLPVILFSVIAAKIVLAQRRKNAALRDAS